MCRTPANFVMLSVEHVEREAILPEYVCLRNSKGNLTKFRSKVKFNLKDHPRSMPLRRKVHAFDPRSNQPRPDAYTLFTLQSKVQPLIVTVMVNKKNIPMEVDTGAALSLISEETFNSHFNLTELQPTDVQLRTYSGELISALGSLDVEVEYESQTASVPLIVVKGTGPNLLGWNWMSII